VSEASLGDIVAAHRAATPAALATVCGAHRHCWAELDDRVSRLAGGLVELGTEPGDRVMWVAQNCHRYLEALLACARIGAVLAPVNWRQSVDELAFVLDDADPTVVLWQHAEIGTLVESAHDTGAGKRAMWIAIDDDGPLGYEAVLRAASRRIAGEARDPSRPVLLLYTAAFDGQPNGALLPQSSLILQGVYGIVFGGASADDVYLNAGPLFHVGTLKATMATLVAGGVNVFVPRVDVERLCELIEAERCTGAFLQPPTIDAIVERNRTDRYDLTSLRAKPGASEWNAMVTLDAAAQRYRSGFGQTELGGVVTFVDSQRPCVGSAGRAAPLSVVEIIDGGGRPVAAGETGEIVVRGPAVMTGYHRRAELSAARRRGGWHHTSDLGRREVDGSITFIGPLTRIIKSAAENIYPAEVERCLREHARVRDAAVIGRPDPTWGQRVVAVVVPEGDAPEPAALIEFCKARIASYKKPYAIVIVDELPRRNGAVDYDAVDAAYGGGGYPGSS
jgi:acyl-CoA synthetase (AMP-forming)/AMP-acid ligase II